MKQFRTVFNFELKNYLKNKVFVGMTVFLVAAIAVAMFFPQISSAFGSVKPTEEEEKPEMLIMAQTDELSEVYCDIFASAFPEYDVCSIESMSYLEKKIETGLSECAFVITGDTSYKYYVNSLSMYDYNTGIADEILLNLYQSKTMAENGIPAEKVNEILTAQIKNETVDLGKDQMSNFLYTYIMIFALYMVVLIYGQMIATNVATEKSSRAMELLITSVNPLSMLFGKIIASCLAGLIQLAAIFGSAIVFYNINKEYWSDNEIIKSIFEIPGEIFAYLLLFFVLGFFIYAFIYGAVGSIATKVEDINTTSLPINVISIVSIYAVIISFASGNADGTIMKICSFIPFTSPMAMFARISMSTVPAHEIIISVLILVCSVISIGIFSSKIYRVGVLLYGNTPKLGTLLKAMKK